MGKLAQRTSEILESEKAVKKTFKKVDGNFVQPALSNDKQEQASYNCDFDISKQVCCMVAR